MKIEAYCVRCQKRLPMHNPNRITLSNGKPAIEGKCFVCGTKMFQIGDGVWK